MHNLELPFSPNDSRRRYRSKLPCPQNHTPCPQNTNEEARVGCVGWDRRPACVHILHRSTFRDQSQIAAHIVGPYVLLWIWRAFAFTSPHCSCRYEPQFVRPTSPRPSIAATLSAKFLPAVPWIGRPWLLEAFRKLLRRTPESSTSTALWISMHLTSAGGHNPPLTPSLSVPLSSLHPCLPCLPTPPSGSISTHMGPLISCHLHTHTSRATQL